MLKSVPDQMVGPVARSRGWDEILSLDAIIRLKKASPEEVQHQIEQYISDRKTLDISAESQKKWASPSYSRRSSIWCLRGFWDLGAHGFVRLFHRLTTDTFANALEG